MRINSLLTAIKNSISTALPDLLSCEVHGGRFDLAELKRIAARCPAVYVAFLGSKPSQETAEGMYKLPLKMVAFVVTKDARNLPRHESALNIAERLGDLVFGNRWEQPRVFPSNNVAIQNLYSGKIDKHGVALYAVAWDQEVLMDEPDPSFYNNGTLLKDLYVGLAPRVGTAHKTSYVQTAEVSQ